MSLVFVDTNILLYRHDPRDLRKQTIAAAWVASLASERRGRISWQVLHEFYFKGVRKLAEHGLDIELARDDARWLAHWNPLAPDLAVFEAAWAVQDRYGFSWWDALIVATALRQRCATLLSEDMQDGLQVEDTARDGLLRIINPFAPGAPQPA